MIVKDNIKVPNTLAVPAFAHQGCEARTEGEVRAAWKYAQSKNLAFVPLGAGSNIIPHRMIKGFVCLLRSRGIELLDEDARSVRVRVAAGENWHEFVLHSLRQGWSGLENLALIPGSVGAAPVQNIGAYGVEIAQFIEDVGVIDMDGRLSKLDKAECGFSYRESLFKRQPGFTILTVTFTLLKTGPVMIDYPELQRELHKPGASHVNPTPWQVAEAVMTIRRRKLPDPSVHPNAGSFFKNPLVPAGEAEVLRAKHTHLALQPAPQEYSGFVKLSAAQLIELAGWKNNTAPNVACWDKQPLVLINRAQASGDEILAFATAIQADILARYGVSLELEPAELS